MLSWFLRLLLYLLLLLQLAGNELDSPLCLGGTVQTAAKQRHHCGCGPTLALEKNDTDSAYVRVSFSAVPSDEEMVVVLLLLPNPVNTFVST